MNSAIEIYRGYDESRASVINRAVELANRTGRPVIICANSETPPVMINPGDTPGQAAKRMAEMHRQMILVAVFVWGGMIAFFALLVLWWLSGLT